MEFTNASFALSAIFYLEGLKFSVPYMIFLSNSICFFFFHLKKEKRISTLKSLWHCS